MKQQISELVQSRKKFSRDWTCTVNFSCWTLARSTFLLLWFLIFIPYWIGITLFCSTLDWNYLWQQEMSFIGTQQKCKACEKTVHFIEQVSADGVPYHRTCFKCSHCNGQLSVGYLHMSYLILYCFLYFNDLCAMSRRQYKVINIVWIESLRT